MTNTFNQYPTDKTHWNKPFFDHKAKFKAECQQYSSWDKSKENEYKDTADRMLARYNPGNKLNEIERCTNTFGDDARGMSQGWTATTFYIPPKGKFFTGEY